ncbi:hypothetical protein Tco_0577551 [Tanacetum coccineum]
MLPLATPRPVLSRLSAPESRKHCCTLYLPSVMAMLPCSLLSASRQNAPVSHIFAPRPVHQPPSLAIAISYDSSDESVGSPPSRVILFGDIPTVIPSTSVVAPETFTIAPVISSVTPVVETTLAASPTGLCGLIPYSDSDSNSPDEMSSPEHISPLPGIHILCTDYLRSPGFLLLDHASQDLYVMMLLVRGARDSYSSKASIEEDTEINLIETEFDIELGYLVMGMMYRPDYVGSPHSVDEIIEQLERDSSDSSSSLGMVIVRIVKIETVQRRLEAD